MIVTFDTETTGLDTKSARIVELVFHITQGDAAPCEAAEVREYGWRLDPEMPIPPSATALHGITDADVMGKPTFARAAELIATVLKSATVIVGYNLDFDLRILKAEFERASLPWPVSPTVLIVDVYRLWGKLEPRKLTNAHARFCDGYLEDAHSARADVSATRRVLRGMLEMYPNDPPLSWEELALFINPDGMLRFGASNHLRWNGLPGSAPDADLLLITFGKHAGKAITVVAGTDSGYLRWIIDGAQRQDKPDAKSFPEHVVEACRQAIRLAPQAFTEWAKRQGGRA